jgi:Concanavalin A-like lectin/glucanases superfamily
LPNLESSSRMSIGGTVAFVSALLSLVSFFFLDLDLIVAKLGFHQPSNPSSRAEVATAVGEKSQEQANQQQELGKSKEESADHDVRTPRATRAPYGVDDHTVSLWIFDDDRNEFVSDSVGLNNGRAIGGALITAGRFGMARSFGGSYLEIEHNASLNVSQAISVELWVRPIAFDLGSWNESEQLLNKGGQWHTSGHNRYGLTITRNGNPERGATEFRGVKFSFEISEWPASFAGANSSHWHPPNEWYFVVGTYDGRRARLYVNGQIEAESEDAVGLLTNNEEPLFINNHTFFEGRSESAGRMAGLIDEVRISNVARSAKEIEHVYRSAK